MVGKHQFFLSLSLGIYQGFYEPHKNLLLHCCILTATVKTVSTRNLAIIVKMHLRSWILCLSEYMQRGLRSFCLCSELVQICGAVPELICPAEELSYETMVCKLGLGP